MIDESPGHAMASKRPESNTQLAGWRIEPWPLKGFPAVESSMFLEPRGCHIRYPGHSFSGSSKADQMPVKLT